jgi:hypothetical protein
MSITTHRPIRRVVGLAATAAVVGAGLAVAFAAPSSSVDTIPCTAESATLVISNGSDQYFECGDEKQGVASKNPWINAAEPALFQTPTTTPNNSVPQIFTGSTQGAGVISNSDRTGSERDSISRNESITIRKDKLEGFFGSLTLNFATLQDNTIIRVQATDGGAVDTLTVPTAGPGKTHTFFATSPQYTDGFTISLAKNGEGDAPDRQTSGEFQIESGSQFNFATGRTCDINSGDICELTIGTTTLRVTNTDTRAVTVRVEVDDTADSCGTVDLPTTQQDDFYSLEVFCERSINYEQELFGEVDLLETGLDDLKDCAVVPIDPIQGEQGTKQSCIKDLQWSSNEDGDGLRSFTTENWLDSDPRYA